MLNQTTSVDFKNYGLSISKLPVDSILNNNKTSINPLNKSIDKLYICNEDLYISKSGSVLLIVSKDSDFNNIDAFLISEKVKLNKGTCFNFIPISNGCHVNIYGEINFEKYIVLDKPYEYTDITPNINIDTMYIRLYQEKGVNYNFNGEKHYFWELTFVDRGILYTNVDGVEYKLNQGDFMFYCPFQYHSQHTDDKKPCSYLTVCFSLDFKHSSLIENKVFTCNKDVLYIMSNLIKELNNDNAYSLQLSICYLKELILKTISTSSNTSKPLNRVQQYFDDAILNNILKFIDDNVYECIDINDICSEFGISSSKLQQLFKLNIDTTIKAYINDIKLKKSKDLLMESNYTISEISNLLGFNSIHYFSKKFKSTYGFSPREYLKSVNNVK